MDLQLAGKTVLVTGASSGVGLATARMLLAEGARVAGCARDVDRLRSALGGAPDPVHAVACDVLDQAAVTTFVTSTVDRWGGVDAVVCNAGRSLMATLDETSDAQIRDELELKVFGALNVIRAAQPHLAESDDPSVVVVNAILSRQPEPRLAVTSAARAALLNLTRSLTSSLGVDRIRVNSVLLGLIDTGQWSRRYAAADTDLTYAQWAAEIAADRGIVLGRFGAAEEVAFAIVSLLSPLSGYTTGASVDVGGGIARYL
ncbi:SDR family oxidoreductase [Leekyejoonella antrihumi]|uniref:SDR family oxidoreductase n=1 Tax=Leekyejoonella antrihumi TaxID=1660198 RepID=A0A563DYC5_9MICO|nr:SDR family oxidoreductase [Leekyejoonella antrihumi]TWP34684.1 SDR family oxidoreductase [Leekyejoonella antrihumi]